METYTILYIIAVILLFISFFIRVLVYCRNRSEQKHDSSSTIIVPNWSQQQQFQNGHNTIDASQQASGSGRGYPVEISGISRLDREQTHQSRPWAVNNNPSFRFVSISYIPTATGTGRPPPPSSSLLQRLYYFPDNDLPPSYDDAIHGGQFQPDVTNATLGAPLASTPTLDRNPTDSTNHHPPNSQESVSRGNNNNWTLY